MPTLTRNGDNLDMSAMFRRYVDTYTGPASYVTGGDSFVAGDANLGRILKWGATLARNAGGTIYLLWYDATNAKVLWFVPSTGAQVANATDLSGFTAVIEVIGK